MADCCPASFFFFAFRQHESRIFLQVLQSYSSTIRVKHTYHYVEQLRRMLHDLFIAKYRFSVEKVLF